MPELMKEWSVNGQNFRAVKLSDTEIIVEQAGTPSALGEISWFQYFRMSVDGFRAMITAGNEYYNAQ